MIHGFEAGHNWELCLLAPTVHPQCHLIHSYQPRMTELLGVVGWWMVLGKLPVPGRPTILIAVGAGGGGLDIFTLIYPFSLSLGDGPI